MTSEEIYLKWELSGLIPPNIEYGDCLALARRLEYVSERLKNYIYRVDSVNEIFTKTVLPVITRMYMKKGHNSYEMVIFEEYERFLKDNEELYDVFKDEPGADCELELVELFMKFKGYE